MSPAPTPFRNQLQATFRAEAEEHLQLIEAGLAKLERSPAAIEAVPTLETIFRAAHSLKGAAQAVDFGEIEAACQSLEDVLSDWKRDGSVPSARALDPVHELLARINASIHAPVGPTGPGAAADARGSREESTRTQAGTPAESEFAVAAESRTVRVALDVLHDQLVQAEEMLAVKLAADRRVRELRELARKLGDLDLADPVSQDASHPPQRQARCRLAASALDELARNAERDRESVDRMVDDLLARSKRLLLLPFSSISATFPRLVRELGRAQGKEIELVIHGKETSIDKRILDTLKDPLLHLLRNGIGHGIETPEQRVRAGKRAQGRIEVRISQLPGSRVQIEVTDDGAGIDGAAVKAAAIARGWLTTQQAGALSEADADRLVFRSDLSTSAGVTHLSGRGLGLPIVQEKVGELGGHVDVRSTRGIGTTFEMTVPALRATFRGVLVQASGRMLVLPTPLVERVLRVRAGDVRTVGGRETISHNGHVLPLVPLARVLGWTDAAVPAPVFAGVPVVVAGRDGQAVALAVQEVLDEREFLVKPLRPPLTRVRHVSAAAVLPSGGLALVLHGPHLLESAHGLEPGAVVHADAPAQATPPAILVAEDSITTRILIKSTLEAAGYRVVTAIDGVDAWAKLQAQAFDLLVSDVEMPRLNGFELTEKVRADTAMASLPVVLVTALETPQHRERGLDLGASAYIAKSGFGQTTLLETVRRLL